MTLTAVRAAPHWWLTLALAPLFGAGMTLSFAPSEAWWFTPFCLCGLYTLSGGRRPLAAMAAGALFGAGWFGAGFWWIAPALTRHAEAGPALALGLTVALVTCLSLFPAAALGATAWLRLAGHRSDADALPAWQRHGASAALWTVAEWLRGHGPGGMPWLTTGYSQAPGPLAGLAPLIGVYGLTWLVVWLAAWLADWLPGWHRPRRALWGLPLAVLAVCGGAALSRSVAWSTDTGRLLSVSLLQGNLGQGDKFTPRGVVAALDAYAALAARSTAQLTVLPETALPIAWGALPLTIVADWHRLARERQTTLVLGALLSEQPAGNGPMSTTNSALAITPLDSGRSYDYRYDKQYLVPFGEAVPAAAAWLRKPLGIAYDTFVPGPARQAPLVVPGATIALSICFESLFDTVIAERAANAELILSISNFSWFDGTYAAAQHLQVAQLRAMENGRWVAQVANSGLTALIDQHGQRRAALPAESRGALDGSVRLYRGHTPFMILGNIPLLLSCAGLCGAAVWRRRPASAKKSLFFSRTLAALPPAD